MTALPKDKVRSIRSNNLSNVTSKAGYFSCSRLKERVETLPLGRQVSITLPIFLAKVDYRTKESGVFHAYHLTGDKDADIAAIQESYKSVYGKFPHHQFPSYAGPMPKISEAEAMAMRALYSFKGVATLAEIAARAKFHEVTAEMLDFLVVKGILERMKTVVEGKTVTTYRLTLAGNGCLLHLTPSLT